MRSKTTTTFMKKRHREIVKCRHKNEHRYILLVVIKAGLGLIWMKTRNHGLRARSANFPDRGSKTHLFVPKLVVLLKMCNTWFLSKLIFLHWRSIILTQIVWIIPCSIQLRFSKLLACLVNLLYVAYHGKGKQFWHWQMTVNKKCDLHR